MTSTGAIVLVIWLMLVEILPVSVSIPIIGISPMRCSRLRPSLQGMLECIAIYRFPRYNDTCLYDTMIHTIMRQIYDTMIQWYIPTYDPMIHTITFPCVFRIFWMYIWYNDTYHHILSDTPGTLGAWQRYPGSLESVPRTHPWHCREP